MKRCYAWPMLALVLLLPHDGRSQQDLSKLFADSTTTHLPVIATFKGTTLVNLQTTKTLHAHDLLFIVGHRFGDFAGSNGGGKTFFGMDAISDVLIGFEYGFSNRFTAGIGRDKGAPNGVSEFQTQLFYLTAKYRLLDQTTDGQMPVSLALFARGVFSAAQRQSIPQSNIDFQQFGDRWSGVVQFLFARKFSESFSAELIPTWVARALTAPHDPHLMFALGAGFRYKINKRMGIIADFAAPFRSQASQNYYKQQFNQHFYFPIGIGWEIETGGHVFHIEFTNATSILENQFIPGTTTSWTRGQFRWGFNLTRTFTLARGAAADWKQ
ncbi:MAG: hypothetical protein IMW88_06440 [Thermoflavifilum sp.]|uniref:DUF5777 family beta-barrel protein n=1 Tax=Thermoflavifilum sp. TaxID=1968839 RepID=UPI0018A545CB|nr:DUF5777 family beta-barrel protein [Thermoflavifilum sp.]QOR75024.1 MAG: hypothetical protein IMW88_06440 [Thermoflavifilum sp.]